MILQFVTMTSNVKVGYFFTLLSVRRWHMLA